MLFRSQRQHVLAHRPVAYGVGAGSARAGHAADRGIGARIDRKEQAGRADVFVQLLARDAGLHDDIAACRRCPRLVEWREQVAVEKRAAYRDEPYWGRPVPGFGDARASVMVLGLAPAPALIAFAALLLITSVVEPLFLNA